MSSIGSRSWSASATKPLVRSTDRAKSRAAAALGADATDTDPPTVPQLPPDLAAQELPGNPGDPSDLDRRLASALERAGHALRTLIWTQATAHGLSPIQVQLLLRLWVDPPERRRVGTLPAEFDLSAATVSEALAALRRKGLVEEQPVPGDKRGHVRPARRPHRRPRTTRGLRRTPADHGCTRVARGAGEGPRGGDVAAAGWAARSDQCGRGRAGCPWADRVLEPAGR
ncbi:MarR family winged helix-turn-helix transcriptional regulator [Streptomyces sp. NPDC059957]|uniref:MarR family winged helix-turn-helix transcriptional regulator n=1 Tax=unclassified Streptomyces TaxID=2593676 RepID=UPI0036577615